MNGRHQQCSIINTHAVIYSKILSAFIVGLSKIAYWPWIDHRRVIRRLTWTNLKELTKLDIKPRLVVITESRQSCVQLCTLNWHTLSLKYSTSQKNVARWIFHVVEKKNLNAAKNLVVNLKQMCTPSHKALKVTFASDAFSAIIKCIGNPNAQSNITQFRFAGILSAGRTTEICRFSLTSKVSWAFDAFGSSTQERGVARAPGIKPVSTAWLAKTLCLNPPRVQEAYSSKAFSALKASLGGWVALWMRQRSISLMLCRVGPSCIGVPTYLRFCSTS